MTQPDLDEVRRRYLRAQLAGDRREALRLVIEDAVERGAPVEEVASRVIREAQREIGALWQENAITIGQEHMATAISHLALAHLYQHAEPRPPKGRKIVVACVEGEQHEFPARLVSDALELAGFEVKYLGANVPTDSMLKLVAQEKPDLLALSATMAFHLPALRECVIRVRAQTAVPLAIGGGACEWSQGVARELAADVTGCDAAEFVSAVSRFFEERA